MAVEKVTMVNVVGPIEDVNSFAKDVFLFNDIELLDALTEVESGRYTLPVTEENIDELLGFANLKPPSTKQPYQKECEQAIEKLKSFYGDSLRYDPNLLEGVSLDVEEILAQAKEYIKNLEEKSNELNFNLEKLKKTEESLTAYSYLKELDIPMRDLANLKNFSYSIGSVTNDNAQRLKVIYPSVPSIIFHIGDTQAGEQVFLVISVNDFEAEAKRILKALNFKPVEGFDPSYQGTPDQILKMLEDKKVALEREVEVLEAVQHGNLKKTLEQANLLYNKLIMLSTVSDVKTYMAFSNNNFYFSGWIPVRQEEAFKKIIDQYKNVIIIFEKPEKGETPPTKLLNNWLFRPFEQLVKMYGIPNYHELDPTPFLSLTYILFFGYMFGDVGQGIVLLLGGLLVEKRGIALGGVVARIAVSSIIFGFLYGSVFGVETLLPALWIRPMSNTTTLLLTAVVIGVVMLIIAYIYGLINKTRQHEVEQEYFGKNGYSGFGIYLLILVLGLMLYHYLPSSEILEEVLVTIIIILTIAVFLALPLTNLLEHKRFAQNVEGEYYVSSFFEVFEMYLSMLSNTLSFIRVGAFALTHVGMFMAFETIADMAGGGVAGVAILVLGNIFIIVLEGLIDFIQCLRLEFYELFGKYYEGDGTEFMTVQEKIKSLNP